MSSPKRSPLWDFEKYRDEGDVMELSVNDSTVK